MLFNFTALSAWTVFSLIISLYGFSLWALFEHRTDDTLWQWSQAWTIIKHSSLQAFLSASLSSLLGVLIARAFFYLNFIGKSLLYRMIAFSWALPSLVVIFAFIGVWGNAGWLAEAWRALGGEWHFSLYGLQGILLAHLFLNIPLVVKYCLEGLSQIPSHQHQLAAQLNLKGWHYWRIVELPTLKTLLPYAYTNVFLVCFTSFPIVLMLGGSPKYSTLEVAIYQAVTFEFDFAKAVMLIMVQLLIGLLLQLLMEFATKLAFDHNQPAPTVERWKPTPRGSARFGLQLSLIMITLFTAVPLLHILWSGIRVTELVAVLTSPSLWQAGGYSLMLSLITSFSVMTIAYLIALEARKLGYRQRKLAQSILAGSTTYPLILPIFLLAVGLFLLLMDVELSDIDLLLLVGFCNGLTLLPFVYRLIYSAMWKALVDHDKLARSLGLKGFRRWWIVELPYLKRPMRNAFALSMSASLGNFSVIAFFGSPDFLTLPYLLYQQLGSYRTDEAAVTALVLMLLALFPFLLIEQRELK